MVQWEFQIQACPDLNPAWSSGVNNSFHFRKPWVQTPSPAVILVTVYQDKSSWILNNTFPASCCYIGTQSVPHFCMFKGSMLCGISMRPKFPGLWPKKGFDELLTSTTRTTLDDSQTVVTGRPEFQTKQHCPKTQGSHTKSEVPDYGE